MQQEFSIKELDGLINQLRTCPKSHCNGILGDAEMYPHSGGVLVINNKGQSIGPQWVYSVCLKCGYEWSFYRLLKALARKQANEPLMMG